MVLKLLLYEVLHLLHAHLRLLVLFANLLAHVLDLRCRILLQVFMSIYLLNERNVTHHRRGQSGDLRLLFVQRLELLTSVDVLLA